MPGPLVQAVILFARYLGGGRDADAPAIDGALAAFGRDRTLRAPKLAHIGAGVQQESKSTRHQRTARLRIEFHEDPQHEAQHKPQQPRHRLEEFRHAEGEVQQLVLHAPPIARCLTGTRMNPRPATPKTAGDVCNPLERSQA